MTKKLNCDFISGRPQLSNRLIESDITRPRIQVLTVNRDESFMPCGSKSTKPKHQLANRQVTLNTP